MHTRFSIPKRSPIIKRKISHVRKVLLVASGKGGVGKSTVATNLAFTLAAHSTSPSQQRLKVGLLDLDVFGPSIPKLMGLENVEEPNLTPEKAIVPLINHGIPCMSMGFLLPRPPGEPADDHPSSSDTPLVWRGLMVQKAVQQLLFDVDWSQSSPDGSGLDLLVIDLPPGTGDVPLTLGQLVEVDAAVIVSTPQDVALSDVRKGIAMFRKLSIPLMGMILNQAYFICPSCAAHHQLFGSADSFYRASSRLQIPTLTELPLVPQVSEYGDKGMPYPLKEVPSDPDSPESKYLDALKATAATVRQKLDL